MKQPFYKLMLVTHKNDTPLGEYLNFMAICAKSGITCVQLREKNRPFPELLTFGKQLQALLKPLAIPLIVNDDIELACQLDADGVHLGQSDGSILQARERLGPHKIIGLSIDSQAQLYAANQLPIDYVGIGAIFPTTTKKNVSTLWGCDGLQKLALSTTLPIIAIGGIDEKNATSVMQSGAQGLAAIGAFHEALNPANTTQQLRRIIDGINHD